MPGYKSLSMTEFLPDNDIHEIGSKGSYGVKAVMELAGFSAKYLKIKLMVFCIISL